jgi:GDPmannose 4,6-dehydratase
MLALAGQSRLTGNSMTRRALITGITGQDGYYLADLLLEKGYEVHGMLRPGAASNLSRISPLANRLSLHESDICDEASLVRLLDDVRPHELYNLAGNSFVPASWDDPAGACDVMGVGVVRLLSAIEAVNPDIRFCQVSSSEIFGRTAAAPQNEQTPLAPCNPYGAAKALGHMMTVTFRQTRGLFACSAVAFNHESPLRNHRFVPRKITGAAARIKLGLQDELLLGNLEARRDWGYAGDFVRGFWQMLQADQADDYVLATGVTHSVRELAEWAFARVDLDYRDYVRVDPALLRPHDVNTLCGDVAHARRRLGWEPTVDIASLIGMMVDADLKAASTQAPERPVSVSGKGRE